MGESIGSPVATSSMSAGEEWLRKQACLDWQASGLPAFESWDAAIRAVARMVAYSPAPVALMFGQRGILLANEAAGKLFEPSAGNVNGRSVLDVVPDIAPFYSSVLRKGLRGESLSFRQLPLKLSGSPDQETRWYNLDFAPVCDSKGEIFGVIGHANDVTGLTRNVRELSESEQRLRMALEGAGLVGIWTLDIKSNIRTADVNVARIYGLPEDTASTGFDHESFLHAIHPDDRERVKETLHAAVAAGVPYRNRYRLRHPDGRISWVITSAKPVLGEDGKVERLLGVLIDVTEQMQTASALAESRFQFRTLTETLPQIVWSCDGEGRHDYFSRRWSEFTGISPDQITEETWKHLVHEDDRIRVDTEWAQSLATGQPYDIDYRFLHHSGEYRWLRVMALPIRNDAGDITRWFGTSTDIHENYMLAEQRESLSRELERIATTDELTGVLTRRAFIDRANRRLRADQGDTRCVGLLMLDIDFFKSVNDTFGHPAGDRVISVVAKRIMSATRRDDFVGRLGGEEFAVFLPQCSDEQIVHVAERIRQSVQNHRVKLENGRLVGVTISIGVSYSKESDITFEALLHSADEALYAAKESGRNQVRLAVA